MLALILALTVGQHAGSIKPPAAMEQIAWMKGEWTGRQDFNTGGAPMMGDATNHVEDAIGGRYLEERLSTSLPGRKPSDTRHMITFDPTSQTYKAWWFNDTLVGPMELQGKIEEGKLVLTGKAAGQAGQGRNLRATYAHMREADAETLTFTLEMDQDGHWFRLFTTTYKRALH